METLRKEVIERMEGLHNITKMKAFLNLSFEIMMEFGDEGFESDECLLFMQFKMKQKLLENFPHLKDDLSKL